MALTNAERKKKYMEKLKANGGYDEFKKKKADHEKKRRDRLKSGLSSLPKAERERIVRRNRAYSRKKMQEYRQQKNGKENAISNTTNVSPREPKKILQESYKTASALSKAVAKVKRALPPTSAKKKQVIAKILHSFDDEDVQEIVTNKLTVEATPTVKRKPSRAVSSEDVALVKMFYEKYDISRMSANMRDCRKFIDPNTGSKEIKQIRYLMYRLEEVYSLFAKYIRKEKNENPPVKFSKFCSLRPEHVKLVSTTPLDTCFCSYHTNFILCCDALHQNLPQFPTYGPELELLLVCKEPTKNCWWQRCTKCTSTSLKKSLDDIVKLSRKSLKDPVVWFQWIKNKTINRFEKRSVPGTLNDLINHFFKIHGDFLKHSYVKRSQAQTFDRDNEAVVHENGKVATLQLDFAENFNCEGQDEIALAHWNQANV